jgi:transcriptional regulator with PAS, ATPase and Fis domain
MRERKPYRQWLLQIPVLFFSGSLVYLGLPYVGVLTHGCLSVLVFTRYANFMNIATADDRQKREVNVHSVDDVVIFSQQIKPLILECANNLSAILSTQDDALDTLTHSFAELQEIHVALDNISLKSKVDEEVTIELCEIVNHLEALLNQSIRGLQFGDINGQNLIYTKDMLKFLDAQLETVKTQNSEEISEFLEKQPEIIRKRQQAFTNPVSSSSMSSGEVELF